MRISDWSSDVCSSDLPDYRNLADRSALPGHDTAILDPAPAQCTALWGCLNMPDAERRCTDASLLWSAEVDRSVLRLLALPASGRLGPPFDLATCDAKALDRKSTRLNSSH